MLNYKIMESGKQKEPPRLPAQAVGNY